MNGRRGREDLAVLIERSADLKRALVDFACSPRLERSLAAAMLEAGLEEEADAIGTIDRFALQYRLPDGKTVVDRFVASRPDLDAADREMLLGWRDPVEGIFEIRGRDAEKRASERAKELHDLSWGKWAGRVDEYLRHVEALTAPDLIIIGGGISRKADRFLPLLTSLRATVVPAAMQNDAGIVGAALWASLSAPAG